MDAKQSALNTVVADITQERPELVALFEQAIRDLPYNHVFFERETRLVDNLLVDMTDYKPTVDQIGALRILPPS